MTEREGLAHQYTPQQLRFFTRCKLIACSGDRPEPVPETRVAIEAPRARIAGTYFSKFGASDGFQPVDIIAALNQTYHASHAFWTHCFGNEGVWPGSGTVSSVAPWVMWSNMTPILNSHPLTTTGYPADYP